MKILFQGDSITDACRDRSDAHNLAGYTTFAAELLGKDNEYINLGISGNRSSDVLDRYESDIKAIQPDIMTLLIGINDVWRRFDRNLYRSPEEFGAIVKEIITRAKKDCKGLKVIMIEPFLLPAPDKTHWLGDLARIIAQVRKIAVEYCDGFVPMDGIFAKAQMTTDWRELSADGVHPAEKGQKVLAEALVEEIKAVMKK